MNNAYVARAKRQIEDPKILSVIAAKRASQLARGAKSTVKCEDENYLDIALLEIAEGNIIPESGSPKEKENELADESEG